MSLPFGYTFEADFQGSFVLFLGLLVISAVFIVSMNRYNIVDRGLMSKSSYGLILFLRFLAVGMMLLLLFAPDITLKRVRVLPKRLAVILDQSQSMLTAWEGGARELQASIADFITALGKHHTVDLWSMDGVKLTNDIPVFTQELSSFSWSPDLAAVQDPAENVYQAAFIISDGQLNRGRSPLDHPWSKSLPIYPVFPLEPRSNNSLKLVDLKYTRAEQAGEATHIHVRIEQQGMLGKQVSLMVQDEHGETLTQKELRLMGVFTEVTVAVQVSLANSYNLKVVLSLQDGSFRSERMLEVIYEQSRKKVLLVSESVNELHKFLLRTFPDSLFEVYSLTGTELLTGRSAPEHDKLKNLDLIILNEPGSLVQADEISDLLSSELKRSCPLVLFYSGFTALDPGWEELLAVRTNSVDHLGEHSVYWTETVRNHPFYLGLLGQGFAAGDLIKYAPIQFGEFRLDLSGSEILAAGEWQGSSAALILSNDPPRALFNGRHYWKWFFHPQSRTSFLSFWQYLITYLGEIADFKPLSLHIGKNQAATGDYVTAEIVVRDLNNRRIRASELRVWQENGTGQHAALEFTRNESGEYVAELLTRQPGEQLIIAEAFRFGELWGRDTSRIHLTAYNEEHQSRGVDKIFLQRLAEHSGGKIVVGGDLPPLATEDYEETSSRHFRGLRSLVLFVILLTCLVLEWIIRRRRGLL